MARKQHHMTGASGNGESKVICSNNLEEALHRIEAHFAGVLDIAYDAIISIDKNQQIIIFNKRAEKIFGYSQEEIMGQPFDLLLPEKFREAHRQHIRVFSESSASASTMDEREQIYGRRKNGEEFPAEASITKIDFKNEKLFTVIFRDISDQKRWENTLFKQSICDTLTGLYNRRYFESRLEEEISKAQRNKEMLAILLCDLDHFKPINYTLGHQVGDLVLKDVAKSIQSSTRGSDLVFRWGGDEIVVILANTTRQGVMISAERIRQGVQKVSNAAKFNLDVSMGVAIFPEHGKKIDELIRLADRALYIAKRGGDKIHIGEEEYRLDENSIKVVFQPILELGTDQIIGYEALSRDPQGKLSVYQLFKKYDAIGQLRELKRLCFRLQLKEAAKLKLPRLFINVDFDTLAKLEPIAKPMGMKVILEISELEALHDIESHLKVATQWKAKGYQFAIDDFGAGFISLPFVANLIPEYIKIDRSTILKAVSSKEFRTFFKALLQTLQVYSKEGIIAEGIETDKELEVVKELKVRFVQGFLFGKPQELKY